jgi:hypothetical protein
MARNGIQECDARCSQPSDRDGNNFIDGIEKLEQPRPGPPASGEAPGAPTKAPMFAWIAWLISSARCADAGCGDCWAGRWACW